MNTRSTLAVLIGLAIVDLILTRVTCGQAPAGADPARKAATSTRPAPKDAAEVLAAMRKALASESWSCRCKTPGGGFGMFAAESTVTLRHEAKGAVTGIRLTGNFLPKVPRFDAASSDGTTIRVADLDEKVYEDAPWSADAAAMAGPSTGAEALRWVIPLAFVQPSDLVPAEKDVLKLAGQATADSVLCDIIEVAEAIPALPGIPADASQVMQYVVGRDDHLPRRIVKKWPASRAGGLTTSISYELTRWNPKIKVEAGTFEVDVTGMKPGKFKGPARPGEPSVRGPLGPGNGPSFGLKKGDQPGDFTLKDIAGKEHKLSAYKGKVVLAHFSMLDSDSSDDLLVKMKAKHGDKLVILDLVVDRGGGGAEPVKKAKKPLGFPRLVGGETVADAWGINLFSSGVVIGPNGKVAASWPTGLGGPNAGTAFDFLVKKMGDYLKDPSKGW